MTKQRDRIQQQVPAGPAARRRWLAVLLVASIPWFVAGLLVCGRMVGCEAGRARAVEDTGSTVHKGAWGTLEAVPIKIAPPAEEVPEIRNLLRSNPWNFPQTTREQLAAFMLMSPLPRGMAERFMSMAVTNAEIGGMTIVPSSQDMENLSPASRKWIYDKLSVYSANPQHESAFRFEGGSVAEWLTNAGVSKKTMELVGRYIYTNGSVIFFADLPLVAERLGDEQERDRLVRGLAREKTYLLKLRIGPGEDIQPMLNYWGGLRAKDVAPLLRSLSRLPAGGTVDIAHLLTAFARARLYIYPVLSRGIGRDCHWTSMNFFNDPVLDDYSDPRVVAVEIESKYSRIDGQPVFGDLVLLAESNQVYHSCIYVAADFVFTKNGSTYAHPWMFMDLDTMLDFYPGHPNRSIVYMRRVAE